VARLEGNLRVDQNALSLLVGEPVGAEFLPDGLRAVEPIAPIEPGLRSDVLLQRPDILAAEHLLMAANANIGAARAAFFPRVTLTAQAGTLSPEVSSLFGSGTGTWSFAPQILTPIWAGGALRANLAATRTSREIAVAQYEKAIQQAFAEVSDALAERSALSNERSAVEGLVTSLEETHRLATARYEAGIDSYLQVLVVERSLFAARQRLVGLRFAEQANRITLFKVLAGDNARKADSRPAG
jgi:multidrug efflux system outer membrane protein